MLKFEYLIIHSYINEKNKWVVNYLGNELPMNLLSALFCELGLNGWELVSSSTHIEGKVLNRAFIPISAETDVGVSNTSQEIFYFKRILQNDSKNFKTLNEQISYIRSLTEKQSELINKEIEDSEKAQVYIDNFVEFLLSKGFEKADTTPDSNYTFYKKEITEHVNKGLFGNSTKKELVLEKRIDLDISKEHIRYKYFEKVENSAWAKYQDTDILLDKESIEFFMNKFN
jgi:hypothetical protein